MKVDVEIGNWSNWRNVGFRKGMDTPCIYGLLGLVRMYVIGLEILVFIKLVAAHWCWCFEICEIVYDFVASWTVLSR